MTAGVVAELEASFGCGSRAHVRVAGPLELRGPLRSPSLYFLRNVTAGIFAGDAYRTQLHCAPGAVAHVESSSASKVYSMPSGCAVARVDIEAEPGSRLTWGPHATILQAGASLRQEMRVALHPGATVVLAETLVMGRIASGQRFDFTNYESSLEVHEPGCSMLYREAYRLDPGPDLESAMGGLGVLTCVYALGAFDAAARNALQALCVTRALTGFSALPNGAGIVVKALTPSLSEGTVVAREVLRVVGSTSDEGTGAGIRRLTARC